MRISDWSSDVCSSDLEKLSELFQISADFFGYTAAQASTVPVGLRKNHGRDGLKVAMRAKVPEARRFQTLRLVADHIFAQTDEQLLPATTAKTDRQKFQRAFAQEFLLPYEELRSELDLENVDEEEIEEIGRAHV